MCRKISILVITNIIACIFFITPGIAYKITFSDDVFIVIKGDLTYTVKVRTEDPDPYLLNHPMITSKGNSNFKKGDLVNNKGIAKMETKFDIPYLTIFFQGEVFYDYVMDDDDKYLEGADIDEAKRYAARGYEAREYYLDFYTEKFTLRAGRQIVEWGELIGTFFAPGVGVLNLMDGSRVGAAGYTFRDYKVPGLMAWAYYEITDDWSVDAVYAPDFDPRYAMPVSGSFSSFMDMGGFGAPKSAPGFTVIDGRPTKFKDMQQYGGSTKMIFPYFGNTDLTLYYFHYLAPLPMVDYDIVNSSIETAYPELDMFGLSFSTAIEFGLEIQMDGELAYRPNEPQMVASTGFLAGVPSGYERTQTLNWGIGGSKTVSNFLSFTPWIVQFDPMFSVYGSKNLDYGKKIKDGNEFAGPEHTVYYMVSGKLESFDMIDNTYLNIMLMISGALHEEMRSIHTFGITINAKYGDYLGILFGYDYKIGDPEEAIGSPFTVDRDAFTFSLTLYLI